MRSRKNGFRALGLSFMAVLGLLAFSAVSAQATSFKILGSAISGTEKATGKIDTLGILLDPEDNVDLDCTAFEVVDGLITSTSGTAKLLYKSCTAKEHNAPFAALPKCEPKSGGVNGDVSAEVEFLPSATERALAKPVGAKTQFAELEFIGTCAIPSGTLVKGSVLLSLLPEASTSNGLQLAIPTANQGTDVLKVGNKVVSLDGSVWIELTGTGKTCKWGAS